MDKSPGRIESELFTLRIWHSGLDGEREWRGRIEHVLSGEVYYFRNRQMLLEQLERILPDAEAEPAKMKAEANHG